MHWTKNKMLLLSCSTYLHSCPLVLLSLVVWAVPESAGSGSKELLYIPDVEAAGADVLAQLLWVLHSQQPWALSLLPLPLLLHNTALHMERNTVRKGISRYLCASVQHFHLLGKRRPKNVRDT